MARELPLASTRMTHAPIDVLTHHMLLTSQPSRLFSEVGNQLKEQKEAPVLVAARYSPVLPKLFPPRNHVRDIDHVSRDGLLWQKPLADGTNQAVYSPVGIG